MQLFANVTCLFLTAPPPLVQALCCSWQGRRSAKPSQAVHFDWVPTTVRGGVVMVAAAAVHATAADDRTGPHDHALASLTVVSAHERCVLQCCTFFSRRACSASSWLFKLSHPRGARPRVVHADACRTTISGIRDRITRARPGPYTRVHVAVVELLKRARVLHYTVHVNSKALGLGKYYVSFLAALCQLQHACPSALCS